MRVVSSRATMTAHQAALSNDGSKRRAQHRPKARSLQEAEAEGAIVFAATEEQQHEGEKRSVEIGIAWALSLISAQIIAAMYIGWAGGLVDGSIGRRLTMA